MTGDFPAVWLRDNCLCEACRDPQSGQKLFGILDLPEDLAVSSVEEVEVEGRPGVAVTFTPDGHRSCFSRDWLEAQSAGHGSRESETSVEARTEVGKTLWRGQELDERLPRVDWPSYRDDDTVRAAALRSVLRLGFAVLTDTPTASGTVTEVASTFGYVRVTNYGVLFDVRTGPRPSNLAYTARAISPHTDNPYRDPVPTLQLLHCLSNAVSGGDSGLVDGFCAADTLRSEDPVAFEVLTRTPVTFTWSDQANFLSAERPLIGLDTRGRIVEVRFNNRSMAPLRLPAAAIDAFYVAYRHFAEIIDRPEMQVTFRLAPGDCVVFDNLRTLHSRTAFSYDPEFLGVTRHLQGCYADMDGLASTLAVLGGGSTRTVTDTI